MWAATEEGRQPAGDSSPVSLGSRLRQSHPLSSLSPLSASLRGSVGFASPVTGELNREVNTTAGNGVWTGGGGKREVLVHYGVIFPYSYSTPPPPHGEGRVAGGPLLLFSAATLTNEGRDCERRIGFLSTRLVFSQSWHPSLPGRTSLNNSMPGRYLTGLPLLHHLLNVCCLFKAWETCSRPNKGATGLDLDEF